MRIFSPERTLISSPAPVDAFKKKSAHRGRHLLFLFLFFLSFFLSSPGRLGALLQSKARLADARLCFAPVGEVRRAPAPHPLLNSCGSSPVDGLGRRACLQQLPNYRQQWHHRASGPSARITRGPPPGARAPARVSGLFVCLQTSPRRSGGASSALCLHASGLLSFHSWFCLFVVFVFHLKVGPARRSVFDPCLLSSSQGLVPSGGPEIIRRNRIEIMWYVGSLVW